MDTPNPDLETVIAGNGTNLATFFEIASSSEGMQAPRNALPKERANHNGLPLIKIFLRFHFVVIIRHARQAGLGQPRYAPKQDGP